MHYTIDPLRRINFTEIEKLIQRSEYFVLHAPRQSGKTSCLYAIMNYFNHGNTYRAMYVNIEAAKAANEDVNEAMRTICSVLISAAELHIGDKSGEMMHKKLNELNNWQDALRTTITHFSKNDYTQPNTPRPLILMIDEIDALVGESLVSVLLQIRSGYNDRPHVFPQSIILCGVRDVKDYRIQSNNTKFSEKGGSPFNILAKSIRLGNFSKAEIVELYQQHTDATGQKFTPEAIELVWQYTKGQPWLVNKLAYEAAFELEEMQDRTIPIDAETIKKVKENLVLSRVTHLDQLANKLKEERVFKIIHPIISSADNTENTDPDDLQYCIDLGIIAKDPETKRTEISNEIYKEIIPRELTTVLQMNLETTGKELTWFQKKDSCGNVFLDFEKLLLGFQQFYRENSEHWLAGMQYREAAPQLLLQAFLQRVVNGGGWIEREYGLGRGRTDLFVLWPVGDNPKQRSQKPDMHYTIDPLRRINFTEIEKLIQRSEYFVLHAPRQSGKTSCLYAIMNYFNRGNTYRAMYVNIEAAKAANEDVNEAMRTICSALMRAAQTHLNDKSFFELDKELNKTNKWQDALSYSITHYSSNDYTQPNTPRPLILMIDEIDALVGESLVSVLLQIRSGYNDRPHVFPQSIILCGVRDIKDYRIQSNNTKFSEKGGSPFNILGDSFRLGSFSKAEIVELYQQHTDATGQKFTPEAIELVWQYTKGQPWLVNKLANDSVFKTIEMRDRTKIVDAETIKKVKENLVLSRVTHLDQLANKLREERVFKIIHPILSGTDEINHLPKDDLDYCIDLGLITKNAETRQIEISNAIYREVIPREITYMSQESFEASQPKRSWYIDEDGTPEGKINFHRLLESFQQFYRENSEHWLAGMQYREAAPQLLLQAFLQRVVNGGGWIEREYGLGRGRTDLFVLWPVGGNPKQRVVIEIKVKREKQNLDTLIEKGIEQTKEYMQRCNATHGHLFVFNTDPNKTWDQKVYHKPLNKEITLWGC
ncbi:hypothetical protein CHS0354_000690 [Potamilus streckersoni]|uniref:AAA+ ATPase domain-containing protein n=1 Tax=Potamilus streckersoni TaxID=2493646 RepID=A0AAE0W9C3_9BIVA|nr:hypothetical protein CHS0354_000690 [Potamilus streckersoni]